MYKETRREEKLQNGDIGTNPMASTPHLQSSSKVNRICNSVLQVLKSHTATNLQNIITANVCKSPPALEDGLLVVAGLMNESETLAEKAVEHICFLADANKLYDTALGLYNLDLALLVAQQSQKDPREYLPFLQKHQEMTILRRHFSIDDHLGRYSKALLHLYELSKDDHSEIEAYVVKHTLYKDALTLYRFQNSHFDSIMGLYASYLESHSQFHEAAIAYEYLHLYGPASTCYQRASPSYWRQSIFCASQQSPSPSSKVIESLATALAESLTEAKDYESAAYIYTAYLSSIPTAIALLCKGYHFATALQLASLHSMSHPELLSAGGPIDAGLTDAHSVSTELLAECKSQLLAQVPRIRELRLKAAADPLAFYEGEINEDLPDDISVAASSRLSTSASLFTRYTGRQSLGTAATGVSRVTSKNRRREERKRARGKKGSVYEEEYLVASVQRLLERIESVRADVARLVVGLVRRRMREQARAIEGLFEEVLRMCREAVKEIFDEESKPEDQAGQGAKEESYTPVGGDAVLAESIEAAGKKKVAPHIGAFERLTLLGA
jgi:elongator complex protein 1